MPGFRQMRHRFFQRQSFTATVLRKIIQKGKIGSYTSRRSIDAVPRPHYGYIIWNAALLAKKLGLKSISVLEFGVAGGNGLVNMEYHAREVTKILGVEIEIYGFDTGTGLPPPKDYRDLPYQWKEGFFEMNVDALLARLTTAKVVFGNVETTAADFFEKYDPAPVGAISFDVDYYSSTVSAFEIFKADASRFLPRFFCYFDDTIGSDIELYNDATGMRLAIHEFNAANERWKLLQPYNLTTKKRADMWNHQIWIGHIFDHPQYNTFVAEENQQLQLG